LTDYSVKWFNVVMLNNLDTSYYTLSTKRKLTLQEMQQRLLQMKEETRLRKLSSKEIDSYEEAKKIFNLAGEQLPF
jgi:hypothetical protein